jgi:N-acetylneuraminic acid mutarotase
MTNTAELYDPTSGTWSFTGSLNTARAAHTATLLPNGKVLVAGGYNFRGESPNALNSAELYDPSSGTWISASDLHGERALHTSTMLPNGTILFVGGYCGVNCLQGVEIYDLENGKTSFTGQLNFDRVEHMATLLTNGKVLVVGGIDFWTLDYTDSAELFDPVTEKWSITGNLNIARSGYSATLLLDGKVLVAGGGPAEFDNSAELYDPIAETWSITGSLPQGGYYGLATRLADGRVLVTGGFDTLHSALSGAEIYDPTTGNWTAGARLRAPREDHTATLLPGGKVLVAGGLNQSSESFTALDSSELYDPAAAATEIPRIMNVLVEGKKLLVFGQNFDTGAVILRDGVEQHTKNDPQNPQTALIGTKAGKKIKPGDKLQVRNPNGTMSEEFTFSGM